MPGQPAEDLRHADGQRDRAAGASRDALADRRFESRQVRHVHAEIGEHVRRRVDREVVARVRATSRR